MDKVEGNHQVLEVANFNNTSLLANVLILFSRDILDYLRTMAFVDILVCKRRLCQQITFKLYHILLHRVVFIVGLIP